VAKVVVQGAGVVGLCTAMLLAKDGHDVVVVERDAATEGLTAENAWDSWQRRGVNQFRLPHFFLPRFHQVVSRELPDVLTSITDVGALRSNLVLGIPEGFRGPTRPDDSDFDFSTGRRPVMEFAVASAAERAERVDVRRGSAVSALLTGTEAISDVPHVTGVRTESGEEISADLVVDCTGRRSPLPSLLEDVGARPPHEELDDSGFMYYARHFRSTDGSVPAGIGPALMPLGSITTLTLAADNGTWGVVVVAAAKDRAMLGLRDPDRWSTFVKSLPLIAHWLDGTPIDDGVITMTKLEDRLRDYSPGGSPVATGVVAVGDSWSCSNPTVGRGVSIGTLHALALRDAIRDVGVEPAALNQRFHARTEADVRPWFEWTRRTDRHRLGEMDAAARGDRYDSGDDAWELEQSLAAATMKDPDLLRANLRANMVLQPLEEALGGGLAERALELGAGWRDEPIPAPSRDELVAIAAG
jgi:2-polyprenyl-6-methoxyphenol hydroxylase-like FAD-dependent oxidoreductase